MIQALIGQKIDQTQTFLEDGKRIPVTEVSVTDNVVVQVKTAEKDRYTAVQLGFGTKKKPIKARVGHSKKAGVKDAPLLIREVAWTGEEELPKSGDVVTVESVFQPGDIVKVTGTSKGKGFAGGVKRYNFRGGPKTHGQSDRHRAPGSIGQGTTPGRVYKGKRMAGHMGVDTVTVRNLVVVDVDPENKKLYVLGLVPGNKKAMLVVTKIGEQKKFVRLLSTKQKEDAEAAKEAERLAKEQEKAAAEAATAETEKPAEPAVKAEEAAEEISSQDTAKEEVTESVAEEVKTEAKATEAEASEETDVEASAKEEVSSTEVSNQTENEQPTEEEEKSAEEKISMAKEETKKTVTKSVSKTAGKAVKKETAKKDSKSVAKQKIETEKKPEAKATVKSEVSVSKKTAEKKYSTVSIDVVDLAGKVTGKVSLPGEMFGDTVNNVLLSQAVRVYLANQRQGNASTKTRGEVDGSTRKIYRQKGTGRARHGSVRAPIFVKGGIVFGPKPRDYSLALPQKMKRKALFSALSAKVKGNEVTVIDGLTGIQPKTKVFAEMLKKLGVADKKQHLLFVTSGDVSAVLRAGRNVPGVYFLPSKQVNTYEVLAANRLIVMKDAIEEMSQHFLKK